MANKGRLTTGIFCLFLAGLLAWHIALPDRARSETENRTLAQFPDFSWETLKNGSFTAGMEDYFADQFPLRDDWTGLKARCEQLLGKREFNGVYLCGDTLIAKVDEPDKASGGKEFGRCEAVWRSGSRPGAFGVDPLGGRGLEGQAARRVRPASIRLRLSKTRRRKRACPRWICWEP